MKQKHTLRWFKNRIGKTIYRKPIYSCGCKMCMKTSIKVCKEYGHAQYLFDCQNDLDLYYQDKII